MSIVDLPTEVLGLGILSLLSFRDLGAVRGTCRALRVAASDPHFYRDIEKRFATRSRSPWRNDLAAVLPAHVRNGVFRLQLKGSYDAPPLVTSGGVASIADSCPSLVSLEFEPYSFMCDLSEGKHFFEAFSQTLGGGDAERPPLRELCLSVPEDAYDLWDGLATLSGLECLCLHRAPAPATAIPFANLARLSMPHSKDLDYEALARALTASECRDRLVAAIVLRSRRRLLGGDLAGLARTGRVLSLA